MLFFNKPLITGTEYSPVAAGSPGPFDRNIPSGLWESIVSKVEFAGSTVTSHPEFVRQRRILRLAP